MEALRRGLTAYAKIVSTLPAESQAVEKAFLEEAEMKLQLMDDEMRPMIAEPEKRKPKMMKLRSAIREVCLLVVVVFSLFFLSTGIIQCNVLSKSAFHALFNAPIKSNPIQSNPIQCGLILIPGAFW